MLKKIMKVLLSRTFAFILLAPLQIALFVVLVYAFASVGAVAYSILTIITVLVLILVFEQDELNPAYKLMWMFVIVLMPLSGALFYLMWGHRSVPKRQHRLFSEIEKRADGVMKQDPAVMEALRTYSEPLHQSAYYLSTHNAAPIYAGNYVEYYPLGEDFFPRFLDTIRQAKKFVYMQYFIYEEGYMLDTTLEVLREKAAEGVDVRILWDGFGSLFTLPNDFKKKLEGYGIKGRPFSPIEFTPHVSNYAMLNHRDHRKITAVDGEIAFSGGLNFADEYINRKERFGQWKDTSFMVKGEAAFSLTITFLRAWDFAEGIITNFDRYRPALPPVDKKDMTIEKGFVQPYWDSPLDSENISESAYLNVIRHATDYVYITTPYLILDHEMITTLTLAAKSGVDVRILTPGIPDKPLIFLVTQSYYPALLRGGVRIYQYTPGFNHAKMYVSDDHVAIIGSANMDFRSLYLHFENCAVFYGGDVVEKARIDMVESFAKAKEITLEDTRNISLPKRLLQTVARFFAPMM